MKRILAIYKATSASQMTMDEVLSEKYCPSKGLKVQFISILFYTILVLPLLAILLHTIIRIVRHFHKFPIPEFAADIIDNPLRRRLQPPEETPFRHGIQPGMTVLEVGPGNGTYTMATARRLGGDGMLFTVDIEPKMIERVKKRAAAEGISNTDARVADVYALPFEDGFFDLIYMIATIGEIPDLMRAVGEFRRVLSEDGTLVFSELLFDPDYSRAGRMTRKIEVCGFKLQEKKGNFLYYTLIFQKDLSEVL